MSKIEIPPLAPYRQSDISTPPLSPSSIQDLIGRAVRFWSTGEGEYFATPRITCEELAKLEAQFIESGIKIRVDWSFNTRIAVLRMPSEPHELPGEWLCSVVGGISTHLSRVALCGEPWVKTVGSIGLTLNNRDIRSIDQGIKLWSGRDHVQTIPRVVMETAVSEPLEHAVNKAWEYLHLTKNNIHAVIICDVPYPLPVVGGYVVTISVWVRSLTGDPAKDFPGGKCLHKESSSSHKTGDATCTLVPRPPAPTGPSAGSSSDGGRQLRSGGGIVGAPGATAARYDPNSRLYRQTEEGESIWRRTGPTVVYDESLGENQGDDPGLVLDVYDLLRVCKNRRDNFIQDRKIWIPLAGLRDSIALYVREHRRSPSPMSSDSGTEAIHYPEAPNWELSHNEESQAERA